MSKKFIIPEEILTKLLQYLASRPYSEVHQGINALQALEELKEEEKK